MQGTLPAVDEDELELTEEQSIDMSLKNAEAALSREEFNRATAMFDDMDRDHDGVVDIIEFQAVMETVA
jgi:Ca2+-binding EF-hand superfamily protein